MIEESEQNNRIFHNKNTMKSQQNKHNETMEIFPSHSSMTNFVCFDSNKEYLVTCGQDGEIFLLKVGSERKFEQIGFTNAFYESVVSVDWGSAIAGGYLAVAGSKGSLVIYSVNKKLGLFHQEMRKTSQDVFISIKWSPNASKLACGSLQGKVSLFSHCLAFYDRWLQVNSIPENKIKRSPSLIAWDPSGLNFIVSNTNHVYNFPIEDSFTLSNQGFLVMDKNSPVLSLAEGRENKIKNILWSHYESDRLQSTVIILTEVRIYFCKIIKPEPNSIGQKLMPRNPMKNQGDNYHKTRIKQLLKDKYHDLMQLRQKNRFYLVPYQQIEGIQNEMIDYISWGRTQKQIGCYSSRIGEKKMKERDMMKKPLIIRQLMNGRWEKKDK